MTRYLCIGSGLAFWLLSFVGTAISVAASAAFYLATFDIPLIECAGLIVSGTIAVTAFVAPILAGMKLKRLAAGVIALLVAACIADSVTNYQALNAPVIEAEATHAEALTTYRSNVAALQTARDLETKLQGDLDVLSGDDLKAKQRVVGENPDGEWGPNTRDAIKAHKAATLPALATAREDIRQMVEATKAGEPALALAFSTRDAIIRGIALTAVPLLLSFFGGLLTMVGRKTEAEKTDEATAEVVNLARSGLQGRAEVFREATRILRERQAA